MQARACESAQDAAALPRREPGMPSIRPDFQFWTEVQHKFRRQLGLKTQQVWPVPAAMSGDVDGRIDRVLVEAGGWLAS